MKLSYFLFNTPVIYYRSLVSWSSWRGIQYITPNDVLEQIYADFRYKSDKCSRCGKDMFKLTVKIHKPDKKVPIIRDIIACMKCDLERLE